MTSHLNLPYSWEKCDSLDTCYKALHLAEDNDVLQSCPVEWVEQLFHNCVITGERIVFMDDNSKLHRDTGPATEDLNGAVEWFQHGELHREDGPAIEWADGTRSWHINGLTHRVDGPAVIWADGRQEWWIQGERQWDKEEMLNNWQRKIKSLKKFIIND